MFEQHTCSSSSDSRSATRWCDGFSQNCNLSPSSPTGLQTTTDLFQKLCLPVCNLVQALIQPVHLPLQLSNPTAAAAFQLGIAAQRVVGITTDIISLGIVCNDGMWLRLARAAHKVICWHLSALYWLLVASSSAHLVGADDTVGGAHLVISLLQAGPQPIHLSPQLQHVGILLMVGGWSV